jgi:hypothetical protein
MAMKKHYVRFRSFFVKDGSDIWLWEDKWLSTATLQEEYHALHDIFHYKGDTMAMVMESSPPNLTFKRDLIGPGLASWNACFTA